ncbi:MAG: DUF1684 domain-containing protein [Acidobacteriota bacterium]
MNRTLRKTARGAAAARVAPLVLLALAAACRHEEPIPPPPPADQVFLSEEEILRQRAEKDRLFREDPDSPIPPAERASFVGLDYFPYNPEMRFLVRLERFADPEPFTILTTTGRPRPAQKVGVFRFTWRGIEATLTAYQLRDSGEEGFRQLFVPFMDETTGRETYGAGRYIDLPLDGHVDGWYGLDFNLAYHPLCAYGRTDYVCPRTPEENRLPFPVRAGERGRAHQPLPVDRAEERAEPSG